jgi:hypothetical protein
MRMLFCVIGTLVALFVTEASAQMVKAQTGWETSLAAKSENACYSCCRRWQTRMGWSPRRVEACTQKCMTGTGRNC